MEDNGIAEILNLLIITISKMSIMFLQLFLMEVGHFSAEKFYSKRQCMNSLMYFSQLYQ